MSICLNELYGACCKESVAAKLEIPIRLYDGAVLPEDIEVGDWIDISIPYDLHCKKFEAQKIDFKFAMQLPDGYEAHILPRSSTFTRYGLMLTNSMGIIDNSYCGDSDTWKAVVLPFKDIDIDRGTRLFQFRIMQKQPNIKFKTVEELGNKNRGGYGSTGV